MDVSRFKKLPILGILRGVTPDVIAPLTETVISSGLYAMEITMNTPDAHGLIKQMVKAADSRLAVGAGTVLTMDDLQSALDAGATFIVMPALITDVMDYCVKHSIPVFPGALTPQEIYSAWNAGATMVKVFPAKFFGPSYMKEIKGPFPDIKLLACGGVSVDTIGPFFSSGADAVAFGGSIFKKEWIESKKFSIIGEYISALINEQKRVAQ